MLETDLIEKAKRRSLLEKKPIVYEKLYTNNVEEIFFRKDIAPMAEKQSSIN